MSASTVDYPALIKGVGTLLDFAEVLDQVLDLYGSEETSKKRAFVVICNLARQPDLVQARMAVQSLEPELSAAAVEPIPGLRVLH